MQDKESAPEVVGRHAPRFCKECGTHTVLCWLCANDDSGIPVPRELTDEVRDVVHVGICPRHGVIESACPNRTHFIQPRDARNKPETVAPPNPSLIRIAAVCVGVGLVIGFILGGSAATSFLALYR